MGKSLILILLIFSLIMLFRFNMLIELGVLHDPPSVYNTGPGGITDFVTYLRREGFKVYYIESASEINAFKPSETLLMVLSPDEKLDRESIEYFLEWVERGGKLVILDELNNSVPLANSLGVSYGAKRLEVIIASCRIGSEHAKLLLDVYRYVYGGKTLCSVQNKSVAVFIEYGNGAVIIFGDSSIFINSILSTKYNTMQIYFLRKYIIDRSNIVFFEGKRIHRFIELSPAAAILRLSAKAISVISSAFFAEDILRRIVALLILILIIIVITVPIFTKEKISIPKYLRFSKFIESSRSIEKIRKELTEKIKYWLEVYRKQ